MKSTTKSKENGVAGRTIYQKVLDVMNEVEGVDKAAKKAGMNFNPLLHDDVTKAMRPALIKHKLLAIPKYVNQRTIENYFYTECNLTLINAENPREKILKYRYPPYQNPKIKPCDDSEHLSLVDLITKLHTLQETKLNTKHMAWDIVNGKVLEFSYISHMELVRKYYDLVTPKQLKRK